ncbi:class IV adenylate cyclase [Streptomyces sp. NPDC007861]|uniref:class IV adenylate cyclase n=1 Tax=Streptomyces sp. NPDC007861 TaxID=3154893 RepID=UPI003406D71C
MPTALVENERKRDASDCAALLPARLEALGYRRTGSHVETDDYYSRPDVDYLKTVECLRVRTRDGFCEITYKPPTKDAPADGTVSKVETNVRLNGRDQAENARQLLIAIGMVFLTRVAKHRTSYTHPDLEEVTVAVDDLEDVGVFVEVEAVTADPADATRLLDSMEESLELVDCPPVLIPYRDLVLNRHI